MKYRKSGTLTAITMAALMFTGGFAQAFEDIGNIGRTDQVVVPIDLSSVMRISSDGNITDYGTNSTAITLAAAASTTGDSILVPPGTFNGSSVPDGVAMVGSGVGVSVLNASTLLDVGSASVLRGFTVNSVNPDTSYTVRLSSTVSEGLCEDLVINANQADHGMMCFGLSNIVRRVSVFDSDNHDYAVKGGGHRLIDCDVNSTAGNGYIIKADNTQSDNNTTHDIHIEGGSIIGADRGIYFQSFSANSVLYNITVRNVRFKDCDSTLWLGADEVSGVVSNIFVDAVLENSGGVTELGSGTITDTYINTVDARTGETVLGGELTVPSRMTAISATRINAPYDETENLFTQFVVAASPVSAQVEFLRGGLVGDTLYLSGTEVLDTTDMNGFFCKVGTEDLVIMDNGISPANDDPFVGAVSGDTWVELENAYIGTPTLPGFPETVTFGFPVAGLWHKTANTRTRMRMDTYHYRDTAERALLDVVSATTADEFVHNMLTIEESTTGTKLDLDAVPVADFKGWFVLYYTTTDYNNYFDSNGNRTITMLQYWNSRDDRIPYLLGTPLAETVVE